MDLSVPERYHVYFTKFLTYFSYVILLLTSYLIIDIVLVVTQPYHGISKQFMWYLPLLLMSCLGCLGVTQLACAQRLFFQIQIYTSVRSAINMS